MKQAIKNLFRFDTKIRIVLSKTEQVFIKSFYCFDSNRILQIHFLNNLIYFLF